MTPDRHITIILLKNTSVSLRSFLAPVWSDHSYFKEKRSLHLKERGHSQQGTLAETCSPWIRSNDLRELFGELSVLSDLVVPFCFAAFLLVVRVMQQPISLPMCGPRKWIGCFWGKPFPDCIGVLNVAFEKLVGCLL